MVGVGRWWLRRFGSALLAMVALAGCGERASTEASSQRWGTQQQALTIGVPRRLKALDFDAFKDSDSIHEGNCGSGPVDAETTTDPNGGTCNVAYTKAGEWLDYSISVPTTASYGLTARVASALTGKTFRLALDGQDLAGLLTSPSAGWQAFADRSVPSVSMTAGTHTLRVSFVMGDVNLNYVDVVPGRVALPARVEAESYQRAFETTPNANSGSGCDRADGVDQGTTSDTGGGCSIGWTAAGEWLEYDVSVAQAGAYDVLLRVGSGASGKTLQVLVDGASVGTITAPSASWQTFEDRVLSKVQFSAGNHTLRVLWPAGDVNLNYLSVTSSAPVASVPKRIKSLDFSAFQDSDAVHEGNCGSGPVDAETTSDINGGGCNVTRTKAGEWLDYLISVPTAGKYQLNARVASASTGKTFRLLVDGVAVGSALMAPSAGAQAFADRGVSNVQLAVGQHTLRVAFDTADVNLNYLEVSPGTVTLPARIEAELYQRAFDTTPATNAGGSCDRADGVDKQSSTDGTGSGCDITTTANGEWLEYDVNVAQAGAFDVTLRASSGVSATSLKVSLDGVEIGTLTVPNQGLGTYQSRTLSGVSIGAGQHVLRVAFVAGQANLNYVSLAAAAGCTSDAACGDGNACNGAERCDASGQCVAGTAPVIDDGNACTVDSCVPTTGVVHANAADGTSCGDGNACTASDKCVAGTCQGTAVVCAALDACHVAGSCAPATGQCSNPLRPAGASCSDGNACNGAEACNASGQCLAGTSPTVDDNNPCTVDSCDSALGVRHVAAALGTACDDASVCNGREACDGGGQCQGGAVPTVDDGNPCTTDSCNAISGVTHVPRTVGASCSNNDACDGVETCSASGSCVASSAPALDDSNPCTVDSCDPVQGVRHEPATAGLACSIGACTAVGACNDAGSCVGGAPIDVDDGNPCTIDTCDEPGGVKHTPAAAGTACSDGNACNGAETCSAQGACAAGTAPAIDDQNPCTIDSCDAVTGVLHAPAPLGQACDDATVCNGRETCNGAGACSPGAAPTVDDGNDCTADTCDPISGVAHLPWQTGFPCADDDACNGEESCNGAGQCVAGAPPMVDDSNPCTADSCDPDRGAQHVPVAAGVVCSEATPCHAASACGASGQCLQGAPTSVDDGNPCTADSCSVSAGVVHAPVAIGTSCSNGNACDGAEQCSASGSCVAGPPPTTDDGNPCTADSCDATAGVVHAPVAAGTSCADGNLCNGAEVCSEDGLCTSGSPLVTDDGNACTADACDPLQGVIHVPVAAGSSCSDGNPCNGAEACAVGGLCVASDPPPLDDGNPCTADSCDPALGVRHIAVAAGTSCADSNACNGVEICTAAGACVPGSPPLIDDGNPCTADSCSGGVVRHLPVTNGTSCSDGNLCNGLEACSAGACVPGSLPVLDDANPCTADACDPATGSVTHTPAPNGTACDDSNVCNGHEACQAGSCQTGVPLTLDDGNPCTADSCSPTSGVTHQPVAAGTACDDFTVCNGQETCSLGGQCLAGVPLAVDDDNPCTIDSCSAVGGVEHLPAPAGTSCSDGDACNGQEQCSASGACVTTSPPVLDDGNPCTVDTCSPGSGSVQHTPLPGGASCADGDLCNGNEICTGGGTCSPGTPVLADDGNPCTVDSCDPLVGVRHLPLDTPECVGRAGWARLLGSQPSPRDGAAGAFIGTGELLLFGGDNAGAVLADAWLWSPATRAWRRVASGPTARAGASLSYDAARQRAVLFGGVGSAAQGAQYLNDVWEYDSRTDTWSKRTVTGSSPAPRALAAFAFDSARGRALLFGGTNDTALGDTWEWNSALGSWVQLSSSGPSARYGAAFAFDEFTRRYALFGGSPSNATGALGDTWLLSADTGVWTAQAASTAPSARAAAAMAFDAHAGRLVLFGGTGVTSLNLDDTWELSTTTGTWSALATLAAPPSTTSAVLGYDPQTQSVVVATGLSYSSSGRFTPQSNAVWLLDRDTESWTDRSSTLAPPQLRHGAAFDTNRRVLVALGTRAPPERALMWTFDSRVAEWSVKDVTNVEQPFSDGEFSGLAEGTNALFYAASLGRLIEVRRGHLVEYDGHRWTKRCELPTLGSYGLNLLYDQAVAFDPASQRVYLFGGAVPGSSGGIRKNDVVTLDLTTCAAEKLEPTNAAPVPREQATATWDFERGRLIVMGGLDSSGPRRDTWEFDPRSRSWSALADATPPARSGASSVYDPLRRRVVLHGGRAGNTLLYDTWELDPASGSWRQLATTGPSDGEEAALTFDAVRNSAALVSTRGAVWHLSGEAWIADLNPVSPSARSGFSGGYGRASGAGVFFGGTSGDGQRDFLGDLWIWRDGWRGVYPGVSGSPLVSYGQGSPSTQSGYSVPSARTGHVLATGLVDSRDVQAKDVMLLFGGEGASDKFLGLFGDTWSFDVATMEWTLRPDSLGPRGRTGHAMAVFPSRGYVMFGGLGRDQFDGPFSQDILQDTSFADTWVWELSSSRWRQIGSGGPSARYGHAMATDETTNELLLFGGRDSNGVSGETWRLNLAATGTTATWQKLSPPSSPLPRFGHSMTWDPVRRRIVLTGGEGASSSQSFGDTWEWDSSGQRWVLRNVAPLEGRAGHVSFFDQKRGLLLAFGGFSHREAGRFAMTHGDTLAFYRPTEIDPSVGFPNGTRCSGAAECGSGACVDGFCCNSACTGQCGACDLPGFEGTCSPVAGTPRSGRPSCGASGAECATQCNGIDMAQCNAPPVGTPCGPAPGCVGDNTLITGAGSCDANGACVTPQVSCGNYICCDGVRCRGPMACVTNCQGASSLCAVGYKCNGPGGDPWGKCYKPTEITSFTATPASAKVGVPMTFKVAVTEPNTAFQFSYQLNGGATVFTCSNASTCNWTPVATDAGKTAVWKVSVGNAPGSQNSMDDSETLTLTVQP